MCKNKTRVKIINKKRKAPETKKQNKIIKRKKENYRKLYNLNNLTKI